MTSTVFVIAGLLLVAVIARQLVFIYSRTLLLRKDTTITKVRIREEKEYLFIKGLY
ncbi:hypothetical protein Cpin_6089 [Chitinophaga pinensis DSM 2588]|uniref:Uncharacterized protein n=1 Tax=Chitinophaga pinensis (strain ATCC 43595 / DSM 2588 / LMG 13176 / NBRC 15968 / NCIMB 11800 / UQM 2034) TaxID=485918 RepID=A0A979GVL6_CHIPD|nr:hypothetical protein Cpin_6089 [Chitinophaga pinensis DSM 2588]